MKLSVIFITRDRPNEIIRAIESCLENKIKEMEIVVIDNNSLNENRNKLREYLTNIDVRKKYYYSSINLGVAGGRNKAFSMCEGEYIFCLDDDAVIKTNNFFEKICFKMDRNSDVVAAAIEIYEPESEKYIKSYTYTIKKSKIVECFSYCGGAHILRRSFFQQKEKIYPQSLSFGSEELYPSLLIHDKKKILAYFDDLQVYHYPSQINRFYDKNRDINILVNTFIVRKLCYPFLFRYVSNFTFLLRIIKGKYLNKEDLKEIRNMIKERYDKNETLKIKNTTLLKLLKNVSIEYII